MSTTTKADLHRLIDALGDDDVDAARQALVVLFADDPVGLALALAPLDDEPLTEEDLAAIREGEAALARGEVISHADLKRELGL